MERLTTYENGLAKVKTNSPLVFQARLYRACLNRLAGIEDILGDDYDLDRLRELVEADRDGRCVVFQPGHPVVSEYYKEGDFCIREATGVISKKEYMDRLKGEQDGTH